MPTEKKKKSDNKIKTLFPTRPHSDSHWNHFQFVNLRKQMKFSGLITGIEMDPREANRNREANSKSRRTTESWLIHQLWRPEGPRHLIIYWSQQRIFEEERKHKTLFLNNALGAISKASYLLSQNSLEELHCPSSQLAKQLHVYLILRFLHSRWHSQRPPTVPSLC